MIFRKAILVIHGFAGGVYDQQSIIDELQLQWNFDVFSFTLPGHERNLSKVEYKEWIQASCEKVEWLINHGYKTIYLIGHSMGGVIATYLSTKYKEVKKLVLAAPAFYYLKVDDNNVNLVENIKQTSNIIKTYSFQEVLGRFLKLNISSVSEFTKLVNEYHDSPKDVDIPILIIQGRDDTIVPVKSANYVYNNVKSNVKRLLLVSGVNHNVFNSDKCSIINAFIKDFLNNTKIGDEIIKK